MRSSLSALTVLLLAGCVDARRPSDVVAFAVVGSVRLRATPGGES